MRNAKYGQPSSTQLLANPHAAPVRAVLYVSLVGGGASSRCSVPPVAVSFLVAMCFSRDGLCVITMFPLRARCSWGQVCSWRRRAYRRSSQLVSQDSVRRTPRMHPHMLQHEHGLGHEHEHAPHACHNMNMTMTMTMNRSMHPTTCIAPSLLRALPSCVCHRTMRAIVR
jgi:hypothetical protein